MISIVIPVFNGEQTIAVLVDRLIPEMQNLEHPFEVILINDCSSDSSESICTKIHDDYPEIVSFHSLAKNVGEHNAVMAGLSFCAGSLAVIIDDDLQNPVSEVIKLVCFSLDNEYDVVYTYYGRKKHSLFRNLGSRFNDLCANIMLRKPKDLYLSSFKSLNRFLIDEITKYELPFTYIDGLILRTTSNIGRLKVSHQQRETGKSGYTLIKLLSLWTNMFLSFSVIPLRVSMLSGLLVSLSAFVFIVALVIEKFLNPHMPIGYTSVIVSFLFMSGVQLISIGLLGEYIGRIFISQSKSPQFSVRKSHARHEGASGSTES